jgi:hypothetical protein
MGTIGSNLGIEEFEMSDYHTDVEIEIAAILDRLGCEMLAASKRLRVAPYTSVDEFIKQSRRTIRQLCIAGDTLLTGQPDAALALLRSIDVPEIDFNNADENIEPNF